MGDTADGDDIVRFALALLDHVKTTRLSKEVGVASGCGQLVWPVSRATVEI